MATINVPARNRAAKALLERTYDMKGDVTVRAGAGTSRHWIKITFWKMPDDLAGKNYGDQIAEIEKLLNDNDIQFSTYSHDDGQGASSCIDLNFPRGNGDAGDGYGD